MKIFKIRESASFGPLECLSLALYSVVLAIASSHHEAWLDEAQAWLIARDCSLREIFLRRLHYEVTPGLWHLYLWILARLHVSYSGMHWISAGLAVFGIFLLLRYSPFPAPIRLLLPFTFFLQYQFSVIARSYLFFLIGTFALAYLFDKMRPPRPVMYSLIAGLTANTSLFGAAAALGFEISYLLYLRRCRSTKASETTVQRNLPIHARAGALLFLALFLIGTYTAIPSPEQSSGRFVVKNRGVEHILDAITLTPPVAAAPVAETSAALPYAPEDLLQHSSGSLRDHLWRFLLIRQGVSKPNLIARKLFFRLYMAYCVLAYPVATQNWIAIPFLVLCFYFLLRRRQLHLLLGFGLLTFFCIVLQPAPHHEGVVWIALVSTLWIALAVPPTGETPKWLSPALFGVFLVVIAGQIGWTVHAVRMDYTSNYDGSKDVAKYISGLPANERVAAFTHHTVAIQPYFSQNRFFNEPTTYWLWSKSNDPDRSFTEVLKTRPDLVIFAESRMGNENVENQLIHLQPDWTLEPRTIDLQALRGYSPVGRFCGELYMRFGSEGQICYRLFVPST